MKLLPVAGIDVGKNFSEMAILTPTNEVYARMKIRHDSCHDIDKAVQLLQNVEKDFGAKPVIIMESTGHYHKILFYFLNKLGYEVSATNPIQTNSIKNVGIRKVKNDKVDARKIALLYRLGEISFTKIPDAKLDCLKSLCRQYYNLSDELTAYKNRLTAVVDQLMLNFNHVFKDNCSLTALAVLEKYPSPKHILEANQEELITLIQKTSRKSSKWAKDKYELLCSKAKDFEPLSIDSTANLTMLKINIIMIRTLSGSLKSTIDAIHQLLKEDVAKNASAMAPIIELLCTIPGIGVLTAATILSEIRDFSLFSKPDKLAAFFGIDPSVTQSGNFEGTRNKMSKRGAKLLRRVLFTVALANIGKKSNGKLSNPVLHEFYQKKCMSKPKMVAIGAVMHKLVFIIFAVFRDRKPFELRTPEEHAIRLKTKASAA